MLHWNGTLHSTGWTLNGEMTTWELSWGVSGGTGGTTEKVVTLSCHALVRLTGS